MEPGHIDELTRQASHVRLRELRFLESCERGLAAAYRKAQGLAGVADHRLAELAARHLAHADLLRARLEALGGQADQDPEDLWVTGLDRRSLSSSEHRSLATYHDHLTDFDRATADAVRRIILPEHARALELLDPSYQHDRDGDL